MLEIHKIAGVMHTIVSADEALEAKSEQDLSHRLFLKGAWSEQIANRSSNGATRASKSDKKLLLSRSFGGRKNGLSNA